MMLRREIFLIILFIVRIFVSVLFFNRRLRSLNFVKLRKIISVLVLRCVFLKINEVC